MELISFHVCISLVAFNRPISQKSTLSSAELTFLVQHILHCVIVALQWMGKSYPNLTTMVHDKEENIWQVVGYVNKNSVAV